MNSEPPQSTLARDLDRERLTNLVLDATTLTEIHLAQRLLRDWIKAHPEEEGMRDAFEELSLLEDIALEEAKPLAERAAWLYAP